MQQIQARSQKPKKPEAKSQKPEAKSQEPEAKKKNAKNNTPPFLNVCWYLNIVKPCKAM